MNSTIVCQNRKIQERFLQNGDCNVCKNIEKFCNENFRFLCMPRFASVFVIQGSLKITIFYFSILNVYNVSIKTIWFSTKNVNVSSQAISWIQARVLFLFTLVNNTVQISILSRCFLFVLSLWTQINSL